MLTVDLNRTVLMNPVLMDNSSAKDIREEDLRFSLLEIADLHAMAGEIGTRESHWKEILLTRSHGYNLN